MITSHVPGEKKNKTQIFKIDFVPVLFFLLTSVQELLGYLVSLWGDKQMLTEGISNPRIAQ